MRAATRLTFISLSIAAEVIEGCGRVDYAGGDRNSGPAGRIPGGGHGRGTGDGDDTLPSVGPLWLRQHDDMLPRMGLDVG